MKKSALFLCLVMLSVAACSTPAKKADNALVDKKLDVKLSQDSLEKIQKTIARLSEELKEIQLLATKVYENSLQGDLKLKKELDKKIEKYGTEDTLQGYIKILEEIESDHQISKLDDVKTATRKN